MSDQQVTPVLLAAGAGTRYLADGHKLLATLPGTTNRPPERVVDRSLAAAVGADLGEVVLVTGLLDHHQLALDSSSGFRCVNNPRWADGQMTSVHVGLAAAHAAGADAAIIGLADQPGITSAAWREVAARVGADTPIAVATYNGQRRNPVALHRSVWHLLSVSGDVGARGLMRIRGDLVVQVSCAGQPHDIDTVEDLHRWQNN